MCEDEIKEVDAWFDSHTENYGTYHSGVDYSICPEDLETFADFLSEKFPDLVGISCYFGKGDSGIWFFENNLRNAQFY